MRRTAGHIIKRIGQGVMLLSVLLVAVGLGYIAVWWPSSRTVGDLVTRGYAGWLAMLFIGGVLVFVGNMMEEDY